MKSPFAECDAVLCHEPYIQKYRGEEYPTVYQYYKCLTTGLQFTSTELDEANISQVYNAYRAEHGIPFPDEIKELRKYYGLSAAKMSAILGFGTNQYRLYEDGEVPSVSNARILLAIRDRQTFLDFLEAAKAGLGEIEYNKIRTRVSTLADYPRTGIERSRLNGFKGFSREKIAAVVAQLISEMDGVFVTKMNKLLFYVDFLAFKRRGLGITGLKYRAMQFGPVPQDWGRLYGSLQGITMEECMVSDNTNGIKLQMTEQPDDSSLDDFEMGIIKDVIAQFKTMNARDISEFSHRERGWLDNQSDRTPIDYNYAFDLSID